MWRILQQDSADDYVLATGRAYTVRDFVELAFGHVGIDIGWQGRATEEKGIDTRTDRVLIEIDPRYFRPTEVEHLLGDPSKAEQKLGWRPRTSIDDLVAEMVAYDRANVVRQHNPGHTQWV